MKYLRQNFLKATLLTVLLLSMTCAKPQTDSAGTGLQMLSGSDRWLQELRSLKNPDGILPTGTDFTATGIMYDTWGTSYEFFAYDANVVLILLSNNPVYFVRIETKDFQFHLKNELNQLRNGATPSTKVLNTLTYYKTVGDFSVEVYFTPAELDFVSSGNNKDRIGDKNSTTYPELDLWKLYDAAGNAVFYTPSFDNQKLADDYYAQAVAGKKRLILADSTSIASPTNVNLKSYGLNFSFMFGTELTITDNLLGAEDIRFADRYELTREFAAFFSVPVNNGATGISQKHGSVVIIRGELKGIRDFISAQGVNLTEIPVTPTSTAANPGDVVINEIGSGCNGTAANDYVEIYNKSNKTLSLNGWKVIRDSGCSLGGSWTSSVNLTGSIAPLSYKLVTGSSYAAAGSCPAADIADTAAMTISADDCVAITTGGSDPTSATDANVMDFVGFGNAANVHEGAGVAAQMGGGNNQCISRSPNGTDTNNNNTDFVSEGTLTCSPGFGNGTYNVVSAASTANTTVTVTFSSAPVTAQAQTSGNYCIALAASANCSSPAISVSGAVLAGSTVTLTTAAQTGSTGYKVFVTGVTALAGGAALTSNTANFTGTAPPAFNVSGASGATSTTVTVTFNGAPTPGTGTNGAANTANYSITGGAGLGVTGAVLVGNVVTLTTPTHVASQAYTVTVNNVTRNSDSVPLTTNNAAFTGFGGSATVIINEVAVNNAAGQGFDFIELRVTGGGSMSGYRVYEYISAGATLLYTFDSSFNPSTSDLIVVHTASASQTGFINEDISPNTKSSSPAGTPGTVPNGNNGAWDVYSTDTGLQATDICVFITNSGGTIVLDAVCISNKDGTASAATMAAFADFYDDHAPQNADTTVIREDMWAFTALPNFGTNDAAIQAMCVTAASAGNSSQRNAAGTDTNTLSDFTNAAQTMGTANP